MLNKIISMAKSTEFRYYFVIGLVATLIDWSVFALMLNAVGLPYPAALTVGYCIAGITHYTCNKLFTFQCHSKEIASQFSIYVMVTLLSLLFSLGVMAVLVYLIPLNKVILRMITTGIMLVPNYFLHKYITFSKRLFTQPEL